MVVVVVVVVTVVVVVLVIESVVKIVGVSPNYSECWVDFGVIVLLSIDNLVM